MQFEYVAKNNEGREFRGSLEAANESAAAAQLRDQGMFVLRLSPHGNRQGSVPQLSRSASREGMLARVFPPVGLKGRMQFWAQLQSVLDSGMSLSEGLGTLAASARGHVAEICREGSRRTAGGEPLSVVLAEYPSSFPASEVALVRAGEHAGTTPEAVKALAEMTEAELATRRDFMFQLAYPLFVLLACAFIPLLPVLVLEGPEAAMRVVASAYVPTALVVVAAFIAARFLLAMVPPLKLAWDHVKLGIPGVGGIAGKLAAARAADVLAAAYRSGLDLVVAVELAGDSCGNAAMGRRFKAAAPAIRAGESLTTALARTGAFPARALQMLSTGEKTGDIDRMMQSASRYFTSESRSALKISAVAVGVLALLAAAVIVGMRVVGFWGSYGQSLGTGF